MGKGFVGRGSMGHASNGSESANLEISSKSIITIVKFRRYNKCNFSKRDTLLQSCRAKFSLHLRLILQLTQA